MKEIRVELSRPTARGRLYPRYNNEADLLEVGSSVPREWTYGIDIDGTVIFDIDADRILANFDLLIPKRLWEVTSIPLNPHSSRQVDLRISEGSITHKSFHLPLTVMTNHSRSCAYILFGTTESSTSWITLSDSCLALVLQDRLRGFFVKLT